MALILQGSAVGVNYEVHRVSLTGTTAVSITTGFRRILWKTADPVTALSNSTYMVNTTRSGSTVSVFCTHDGETSEVDVIVWGIS